MRGARPTPLWWEEARPDEPSGRASIVPPLLASLAVLLGSSLVGCGEAPALTVGNVGFTRSDILGLSESQLDQLVLIGAVGIAAARDEHGGLVAAAVRQEIEDARVVRLREEVALERAGIGDTHLEAQYLTNPEPELVVRHLVVLSERWRSAEHRAEARARAEVALQRARAGERFAELAGEVSEEPGARARGGLLEPGREGTWVREFWEAARGLEVGGLSEVVETEYGFHVLRLEERRFVSFEEARPRVAARVAAGVEDREAWERQVEEWLGPAGAPPAADPAVADSLRRVLLLEQADHRDIRIAEPDEERIRRQWEQRAIGWGEILGFRPGMSTTEISRQALSALGRTDQESRLAREALVQRAAVLADAYPVVRPDA